LHWAVVATTDSFKITQGGSACLGHPVFVWDIA
jgi:hypothetical protein